MAPRIRARRQAATVMKFKPSDMTDGEPAPIQSTRTDNNNGRESCSINHEVGNIQDHRPWTPEPEPYDEKAHTIWGRKHYGEDWYEQRELMFRERNFLKPSVDDDHIYLGRQKALREMELERERGKLLLDRGKTWQELIDWARMHYGEAWYAQRQALERDQREKREAVDPNAREKNSWKASKRVDRLREMQWNRDEKMLAEGRTWQEIMAWPPKSSNIPSIETDSNAMPSPSISERSDNSMISTYPPTPTQFRREAMDGPQPIYPVEGRSSSLSWEMVMGSANWEGLEWRAVEGRLSEVQYEDAKIAKVKRIRNERSLRENLECERKDLDERMEIGALKIGHLGLQDKRERERDRRMRDLDLRQKGWTQGDIDAMDREADSRVKRWEEQNRKVSRTPAPFKKPQNQAQMNARFRAWDTVGLSHERQNELARSYGFCERPTIIDEQAEELELQWKEWDERPKVPVIQGLPISQEEWDARHRAWDARGISKKEQAEMVRIFGFHVKPPATDGAIASGKVSRLQAPSVKGISRKIRAGRVTKNVPKRQSSNRRSAQPQWSAPNGESLPPGTPVVDMPEELGENARVALQCRRRQRKTYEKQRASRRLAGQSPEFGMLLRRGETPLYGSSSRQPSNTIRTSNLGSRSSRPLKKPTAVKDVKPRGISKSKQNGAGRPKRSAKFGHI